MQEIGPFECDLLFLTLQIFFVILSRKTLLSFVQNTEITEIHENGLTNPQSWIII